MKNNFLVRRPEQLNEHWAQYILNRFCANATVTDVAVESVNIGTTTRLRVRVEHDVADTVPSNWFVKTPSLLLRSRLITALPRLLHKEICFYQSLAPMVPLSLPPVLAAHSRFGQGSTLVMADIAELGYRPGQPSDALSIEQAEQVVEQLARLHARFWNQADLLKTQRWLGGFSIEAENQLGSLLAVPLMKRGIHLAGKLIPERLHKPALAYAANRRKIIKWLSSGKKTLVHHDCHPGNFFWKGSEPGFLDWQLVRIGEGIGDLAYFLATALEPEIRRKHEKPLLEKYLAALTSQGAGEIDQARLFKRYQAHLTYPLEAMVVTLAIGGMMDLTANLKLICRAAIAVNDHNSYAALDL